MIWAVIGAGSSGIGVVGKLVDHHQQIIWIDPNFDSIGRMGQYYCDVPANTPNGSIWNVLYLCKSFQIDSFIETKKLNNEVTLGDLPAQECSKLGYLVDALQHISPILQSHPLVSVIHGTVTSMLLTDKWNITVSSSNNLQSIHCADYVIMATGAIPKLPSNISPNSPHHPVDMMVNTNTVKQYFHDHPDLLVLPWAVVGSSHSAMLIIKNMIEVGVQRIVNYYRSDFIFEELTEEGWFRTFSVIDQYEDRIIYACGYIREDTISQISIQQKSELSYELTKNDLDNYNQWTGEILSNIQLYGIGIAFPQLYQHEDGIEELWVGFRRNILQTEKILHNEIKLLSTLESS